MYTSTPDEQLRADEALALRLQREIAVEMLAGGANARLGRGRGASSQRPRAPLGPEGTLNGPPNDDHEPESTAPLISPEARNASRRPPLPQPQPQGRGAGNLQGQGREVRMNVFRDLQHQHRGAAWCLILVYVPQIIAAVIVLTLHWDDSRVCDHITRVKWRVWAVGAVVRWILYLPTVFLLSLNVLRPDSNGARYLTNFRGILDAIGMIWFLLGNMWLFGEDQGGDGDHSECTNPARSPVYLLCLSMLIINYLHICLPCILALVLVPAVCFCLPCLLGLLRRMQVEEEGTGATSNAIEKLPLVQFEELRTANPDTDQSCAICLGIFEAESKVRVLHCKHYFHPECVDEWLRLNATCPTCRGNITEDAADSNSTSTSASASASAISSGADPAAMTSGISVSDRSIEMV